MAEFYTRVSTAGLEINNQRRTADLEKNESLSWPGLTWPAKFTFIIQPDSAWSAPNGMAMHGPSRGGLLIALRRLLSNTLSKSDLVT